jgi:uncharacterized protein with PIN domain
MNETDLPCSDCGTALVSRSVHTADLPVSTDGHGEVNVAECPACDARYYPRQTLARLTEAATENRAREDS